MPKLASGESVMPDFPEFTMKEPSSWSRPKNVPSPARVQKSAAKAAARRARIAARKRPVVNRRQFTLDMHRMREHASRSVLDVDMEHKSDYADHMAEMWSKQIDMDERVAADIANMHRRLEHLVQQAELGIESLTDTNIA